MEIRMMPGTANSMCGVFAICSCSCWEFFWMPHCFTDLAGNESCIKGKRRKHPSPLWPEHCFDWMSVFVFAAVFNLQALWSHHAGKQIYLINKRKLVSHLGGVILKVYLRYCRTWGDCWVGERKYIWNINSSFYSKKMV